MAPYIPHATLLPRCALVVTHGGSGSIREPLGLGIPLVIVPQGADHFENAAAVERAGAGITILPDDLNPERVATAAERLLSETTAVRRPSRWPQRPQPCPHPPITFPPPWNTSSSIEH